MLRALLSILILRLGTGLALLDLMDYSVLARGLLATAGGESVPERIFRKCARFRRAVTFDNERLPRTPEKVPEEFPRNLLQSIRFDITVGVFLRISWPTSLLSPEQKRYRQNRSWSECPPAHSATSADEAARWLFLPLGPELIVSHSPRKEAIERKSSVRQKWSEGSNRVSFCVPSLRGRPARGSSQCPGILPATGV